MNAFLFRLGLAFAAAGGCKGASPAHPEPPAPGHSVPDAGQALPGPTPSPAPGQGSSPPAPSVPLPPAPAAAAAAPGLPPLNVQAIGNSPYSLHDYGSRLSVNKQLLVKAAVSAGATPQEQALLIAMAMQETTLMDVTQRDASKDHTVAANCSIFNINYDMLTKLGYTAADYGAALNVPNELPRAIGYLLKAFHTWGVQRTLNFHRGGATAFNDGVSYGAAEYRSAIVTIYNLLSAEPALIRDSRRVAIEVHGV